ncbi:MAG: FapA family protein [Candidatus Scalindua sp.]|nr:FapA family protein [Candidatus Scalindua sp.]MCR4345204.1 FapA family protein [Candidatus Scalindua sp.]
MEETHKEYNLRASEDGTAILLDCDLSTVELDTLVVNISKELEGLGVKNPLDQKQLKDQLRQIAPVLLHLVDFVLIKGDSPVPPQHGRVDWDGDFFNTGFVADKETGKVDYREKAAHESVIKGALLGHQIPAKEGKDGLNVFGEPIPAEEPETYYPEAGENVRFDTNKNAYYAERSGRVRLINDTLFVDEVYTIKADVDITTGNILHTGAVVVNRDVLGGAKIEAAGNIEVSGIIENAEIKAGGDLVVRGGIRQSEGHRIVVEGCINAKYIDGGNIQAHRDIVVEKEIVNSTLHTLGAVVIPRGRIVGGEIVALRGIYVGRVGSKTYTPTMLVAGEDFSVRGKLNLKKIKIKRLAMELEQLKNVIDRFMTDSVDDQEECTEEQTKVQELEQELQRLIKEAKDISSEAAERAGKVVVVEETIYPKTTICIGEEKLTVAEEVVGKIEAKIVDGKIKLEVRVISDID